MEKSTSQLATSQLDPLTALRDTAARFRRKLTLIELCLSQMDASELRGTSMWALKDAYTTEADRLDDLISLCEGTATKNASADTLPVAAETIDDIGVVNEQT